MGKKCVWLGGLIVLAAALLLAGGRRLNDEHVTKSEQSAPAGALSGYTVCLDAGHGGYDGGAVGKDTGALEKDMNLLLARQLEKALKAEGARVILTREKDMALAPEGKERKRRDLQARVDAAAGADVFLSLHMNEYPDRTQCGPQVFYTAGAESSRLLAGAIQQSMNAALAPMRPRSAHSGDYYVLRTQTMPAVLVECGFLSNAREEALLLTFGYRQRIAESIVQGLLEYLRLANAG